MVLADLTDGACRTRPAAIHVCLITILGTVVASHRSAPFVYTDSRITVLADEAGCPSGAGHTGPTTIHACLHPILLRVGAGTYPSTIDLSIISPSIRNMRIGPPLVYSL